MSEYNKVSSEPLLSKFDESGVLLQEKRWLGFQRPQHLNRYLCAALCFFMALSTCTTTLLFSHRQSDRECAAQLNNYSPAMEAVEYHDVEIPNSFAHQTIYRGPPTPELERAWDSLWIVGDLRIPSDRLSALNRTADLGGGEFVTTVNDTKGGYQGMLEVYHQLHCLNLIRQYTWRDYYKRHPEIVRMPLDMHASDVGARMHTDHCIETLRIVLMCQSDVTPQISIQDPKSPIGFTADFSPLRKCRNFDRIQEWTKENGIGEPMKMDWEPGA